jgi:hypothetical protein
MADLVFPFHSVPDWPTHFTEDENSFVNYQLLAVSKTGSPMHGPTTPVESKSRLCSRNTDFIPHFTHPKRDSKENRAHCHVARANL